MLAGVLKDNYQQGTPMKPICTLLALSLLVAVAACKPDNSLRGGGNGGEQSSNYSAPDKP